MLTFNNYNYPFGIILESRAFSSESYRYGFNGYEADNEIIGNLNNYDFGNYGYDSRLGRRWQLDPMTNPSLSSYAVFNNNSVYFIDKDGKQPLPVPQKYQIWSPKISSWFGGPRSCEGCSVWHKGLDINFGGGSDDYGAPVLATHQGVVVSIKNTLSGSGRNILIKSPDGTFQTQYFHLSKILVKPGDKIEEGQQIGEIGGSGNGAELKIQGKKGGYASHLHYAVLLPNEKGVFTFIDPTLGQGNSKENIIDPQKWVTGELEVGTNIPKNVKELEEVTVTAPQPIIRLEPRKITSIPTNIETPELIPLPKIDNKKKRWIRN